jgi:hypothetical protein
LGQRRRRHMCRVWAAVMSLAILTHVDIAVEAWPRASRTPGPASRQSRVTVPELRPPRRDRGRWRSPDRQFTVAWIGQTRLAIATSLSDLPMRMKDDAQL